MGRPREWFVHPLPFYYGLLAAQAARLALWTTEYYHILESPAAIVEWYKGTGLRPFLDKLASASDREGFLADYLRDIAQAYPTQSGGRVIFPFLRQFAVVYRD
jgi:trans-aconitate 2-methyltransferase